MLDIPEDSTLASRRHAAKGILMPRERDHPQHRSWVSVDERGHSMAWIYLACYLNGEANEFEYTTTVMWIYVNWNSWPILSLHKSLVRRRSEQSDAQSRKHSYHVPTEREDIYIYIDWMMAGETTQNWRSRPNHEPTLSLSHNWQIQRSKKFAETICPFFWSPRSWCLFKPMVLL